MQELERDLVDLQKHLGSIGLDVGELVVEPPATESAVVEMEGHLGFALPPSFRNVLLTISRKIDFFWFAPEEMRFPDPFASNFRGDLSWSLDVLTNEKNRHGWIETCFPNPNNPYDSVWYNKLSFYEVGNGDQIAIDLRPETYERIVYLSHDDGEGHGHVLANDFQDLLDRWLPLAFTGGEDWQWIPFTNDMSTAIDPNCPNAASWKKLLQLDI